MNEKYFGFPSAGLDGLMTGFNAVSRSICAENPTGEKGKGGMASEGTGKGAARELGVGWKVSPSINIAGGETALLGEISGSGVINHIWITGAGNFRDLILRIYWDGNENPSVECPLGDFFADPIGDRSLRISSLPVCVNSCIAHNCYWKMPFAKGAKFTLENQNPQNAVCYYQIDYMLCDLPDDILYFHAQFRRTNPLPYMQDYTILDGVKGRGHYVGTQMLWGSNNKGWWGEGEIKFFLDGDTDYPTICGTGTEDYFCGAWDFETGGQYQPFSTPYSGFYRLPSDSCYSSQCRFSMYRWHITDPVCFSENLKVTIQALGWRSEGRYLPLQDDISSVAYWYQTLPAEKFPALPDRNYREII